MTARTEAPKLTLLRDAIGPWPGVPHKLARLSRAVRAYGSGSEARARLGRLQRLGVIDQLPSTLQLVVGGIDMLRFFISPAAADYYERQGIHYGFHQLLRFCDDPASLTDPVGLLSEPDVIIGHLLQVVHANPVYDLQLLSAHERGLEQLEHETRRMLAGDHPRQRSIGAIVEEPDYHARLLEYVLAFRRDPSAAPPKRSNVEASSKLSELDAIFGSMTSAMRYFCRLPAEPLPALWHLLSARSPLGLRSDG